MTNLLYPHKINIQPTVPGAVQSSPHTPKPSNSTVQTQSEESKLLNYLNSLEMQNRFWIQPVTQSKETKSGTWNNQLKEMFNENKAVIWCLNPRTFGAKDVDGNGLIDGKDEPGNFYNGAEKLPMLKEMGINCIHVLPPHPSGKTEALGILGSLYAPDDILEIDSWLGGKEGFKHFIDEAHKNGIHVMVDLPSCASIDMFQRHPELMAFEQNGMAKTPKNWRDIRMFNPWADGTKKILNPHLLELHKKYVDMCIELGVDGVRADVARAKPIEFWDTLIPYSHEKDPNFGWLAETYIYEDASPITNIPYDRPVDCWRGGFDLIYGQWHIFPKYYNAEKVHDYVIENLNTSNQLPKGKSLIGSFATHDDVSPMFSGGADYCKEISVLQSFLPMTCPYFLDGFEKGDWYIYPYTQKQMYTTSSATDNPDLFVHPGQMDIFNLARPSTGDHPDIGRHLKEVLKQRQKYLDVATYGSYIPLETEGNTRDQIFAFARHMNGKTLLVVANKDVNMNQEGFIKIPGLKAGQELKDLCPSYGQPSLVQADENGIKVKLGKARAHVFLIDTPNIEISGLKVYRQNMGKPLSEDKES